MSDAAFASAQVPQQAGADYVAAEPRSLAHDDIGIRDAEHALRHQGQNLLVNGALQAVRPRH